MSTNASADGLIPNNSSAARNTNRETYLPNAENSENEDAPPVLWGQHSTQTGSTDMSDNAVGEWLW